MLSIVDNDHLEPYQLGHPAEDFSGSGHRFSNPTAQVLREIHTVEGGECLLSCIVSIGAGHPGSLKDEQLGAIVRDCVREADELGSRFAGIEYLYFRLNVQQGLQVSLDKLGKIATQTNQYLSSTEVEAVLTSLGEHLHRRPGALSIGKIDISFSEKKEMHQDINHIRNTQDTSILSQLEVSKDARHDSAAAYRVQRRQCTVDTRVGILQQIESWARSVQYPLESSLFWIYGLAGTGKTTIMQTICEILDVAGLLASSYFCSIQLDSKETKRIFPTIARHLARHNILFARHLAAKLRDDPECAHAVLPVQFRELLCNPWHASCPKGTGTTQCVVAIDALDECDSNHGDEVLRLILDAVKNDQLQGLKFLVTSRPVPAIVERAYEMKLGPHIALHEVSKMEVYSDVGRFLNEQLAGKLDPSSIRQLTDRADGLFIFASTLVKYLLPPESLSPSQRDQRFKRIIAATPQGKKVGLDELYKLILDGALLPEKNLNDEFEYKWRILQAVACTAEPTSAQVIAKLLGSIPVDDVLAVVKNLYSVLFSATVDDPIYVVHASFHEFITSQTDPPFKCNLSTIHATLAQSCLSHMQERLRFNICDIRSSFIPDEELDPPIRAIGPLLAYACQHWWGHHNQCTRNVQKATLASIHRLIQEKGLFWIETMSLLGHVRDCRDIFTDFASIPTGRILFQRSSDVQLLANEAVAMISIFISMSPKVTSQLYLSLLPLWAGNVFRGWRTSFHHTPQVISRRVDGVERCQLIIDTAAPVNSVAFSSDNERIISGTNGNVVEIWDAQSGQQLAQLNGHGGCVLSVALSPDGKRIVSGSEDTTVRIWDASSGKQLQKLNGHDNWDWSVAFSPDGKRIVSGSIDGTVRIWDASSGKQRQKLNGHDNFVRSVAFSPDGKRIVSGSNDGTVRIWDASSGKQLQKLNGHDDYVQSVVFSPDGKRIVSGSTDRTVRIWDASSGKQLQNLNGHGSTVKSVAFSPDSKRVVSGSIDRTVRIWDASSGKQLQKLNGHGSTVQSVAFSPDSKRVVSGSIDRTVRIWDASSGKQLQKLNGHGNYVRSVAFSPDGKRIVSGSNDRTVRVWNANSSKQLQNLNGHGAYVQSVAFSPDGKRVVSGSDDSTVRIWDASSGKELQKLNGHGNWDRSVAFSPDGKRIVSGSIDRTVRIWDASSGKQLQKLNGHDDYVQSVAFSSDGKRIVSGSIDRTVRIWDASSGKQLQKLNGHGSTVKSAAFAPDGTRVVSGSTDMTVRIWDASSGKQLQNLNGHDDDVQSVAFSPGGKRIVSGSTDRTVRIWDASSGKQLQKLNGHGAYVQSVDFSPDGKRIVSGSNDTTVRIWDASSGKELQKLNGHGAFVRSVAFSPDGKRIVSGSTDTTVRIWNVGSSENLCHIEDLAESTTSVNFLCQDQLAPVPHTRPEKQQSISQTLSLSPSTTSVYTRKDGWVVTSIEHVGVEHKLLWLPPALRPFHPPIHLVISTGGFNKIDLSGCTFGEGWSKIYRGGH
ncbi:WD40 repeat-like protein [Flagelloscypha sp. PMI_526]|nr:WD40 repeat-like protein [Flagelloscypha sp. PMI_526]